MNVGIIQQHNNANIEDNRNRLASKVTALAAQGAELVVLQELHDSLYFCQTEDVSLFDLAVKIPGEITEFYSELAKKCNVVLVTSLFEKRATGLYHNTAVVFDKDGSMAGKYRKMHIPDDPAYYEKFYFCPGGHAVANGLPVVAVNRVGFEPDPSGQTNGIMFWGSSFVAGPQGEFLFCASNNEEVETIVEVDMKRSENVRRWWPFLRDRRIDYYGGITKRFLD